MAGQAHTKTTHVPVIDFDKTCSRHFLCFPLIMRCGIVLQYTLETFTESRSTKKKKKPYKGGFVDGPENGPAPPPWAISCEPKKLFKEDKFKKEVPHTAKVKVGV